jgi:DNA processing protein
MDGIGRELLPTLVRRVRERGAPAGEAARAALVQLARATRGEPFTIWRLLDRHGEPTRALRAHAGGRRAMPTSAPGRAEPNPGESSAAAAIPFWDARYPVGLWRLADPPPVLFFVGDPTLPARPALAIVGTRRCSEYGRRVSAAIAQAAGARGVVVVSGMAQGIDAAAHRSAAPTGTVAVLGCGLDVLYPRAHRRLRDEIAARGLLLSEFPPGTPPLKHHFPRRNRLIAGLSSALVVVEAPHRSGAQNTVTHALDIGLEVGSVPGPIDRPSCAGSNRLLRDGAAVITEPRDALALVSGVGDPAGACRTEGALGRAWPVSGSRPTDLPERGGGGAAALWSALGPEPEPIDTIAGRAGLSASDASAKLLELELAGAARRWPGARYSREPAGRG